MKNKLLILLIAFMFAGCGDASGQWDYSDMNRDYRYAGTYTYTGRSVAVNTGSNSNTKIINDEWCGNSSWSGTAQYDRYEVYYNQHGGWIDFNWSNRQESDKWVISGTNPTNNANAFQGSNNTAYYFEHSNGDIAGVEIFQTNGVATTKQSDTRYLVDCNAETYGNQYTMYPTWTLTTPDCGENYFYDGETNYNNGFFSPSPSEGNYYFNFWHTGTETFPRIGDRIYSKKNSAGGNPIPFTLSDDLWWVIPVDDSASSGQGYPLYIQVDSDGYVTDQINGLLCTYSSFNASWIGYDNVPPDCKVPVEVVLPMLVRTSDQYGNYTGVKIGSGVRKSPNEIPYGTYPPINGEGKWYIIAQGLSVKINTNGTITDIDRDSNCNPPINTDPVTKECTYNLDLVAPNSLIALGRIFNEQPPVSLTDMATIAGVTLPASFPTDFNKSWGNVKLKSTSVGSGVTINSCNNVSITKNSTGGLIVDIEGGTPEALYAMSSSTPSSGWIKFISKNFSSSNSVQFIYNFEENETAYPKNGQISFTLGNATLFVDVSQQAGDYSFSTIPEFEIIEQAGETERVNIYTNANWTVSASDSWITIIDGNDPGHVGDGSIFYEVAENTNPNDRVGTLNFSMLGFSPETFEITQRGTADTYYLITLTPTRTSSTDACNAPLSNSYYSKNSSTLSGSQGLYTDISGNNPVPNGWYSDGNVARQALSGSLGQSQTCP